MSRPPTLAARRRTLEDLLAEAEDARARADVRAVFETIPGTAERKRAVERAEAAAARRNALRVAVLVLTDLVGVAQRLERSWPEFDAVQRADLRRALRAVGARVSRE